MKNLIGLCLIATALWASGVQAEEAHKTETFVGIGATLEKLPDGTIQIDAFIPNGPAEHSGLAVGDVILKVKSLPNSSVVDVRSLQLPDVVELIRGPIGIPVEISFTRGKAEAQVISIVREKFEVEDAD